MKSKCKARWVLFRINNVHIILTNTVIHVLQVVWNSKNNQIIGLAMTSDQLSSLHDVFREVGEGFRTNNTSYVLQFMWRDLSSKFDVIGPHFTAEKSLETKFLASCVLESLYVFEIYGFHVSALVCDGASSNLALLKQLCVRGMYRTPANEEDGGVGQVPSSFRNPYSSGKVYVIVCPSHQVHMYTCSCTYTIVHAYYNIVMNVLMIFSLLTCT